MFKTYIANGREYFLCGDIKTDFPFPESLMRILYLDITKYDQLVKRMARSLENYYPSHDEKHLLDVEKGLDELAEAHIYFTFLRYDWHRKLDAARKWKKGDLDLLDLLPRKELTRIIAYVAQTQRQIKGLFSAVLDKNGPRASLAEYFSTPPGLLSYQFRMLTVKYEMGEGGEFTDVLYPNSIYDLIDFSLCACLKQDLLMRVCKNCGRYFALTGKGSAEYCSLTIDEKGRTCKEVGAMRKYSTSKKSNTIFNEYRREYKRRFAWIKSGRIDAATFYAWSAEARQKEADCENGIITFEEFRWWLDH